MVRRGSPHTDQRHVVERNMQAKLRCAEYDITIDDPGAYTEPRRVGSYVVWRPGTEIFEYPCQNNNFATVLMIGVESEVDRSSRIVA